MFGLDRRIPSDVLRHPSECSLLLRPGSPFQESHSDHLDIGGIELEQALFRQYLSKLTGGRLAVTYWDSSSEVLGADGPIIGPLVFHDRSALKQIIYDTDLGFGEAYMDGRLDFHGDIHDLVLLIQNNASRLTQLFQTGLIRVLKRGFDKATSVKEQRADIYHHYDLGNDFFKLFLDPSMTYSCAYFKSPEDSLETAQLQKIDHILRKLNLSPHESLLDIGCGWGGMIQRAATNFGVTAHGITMAQEQVIEAEERVQVANLSGKVTVELSDYRQHAADIVKTHKQYDKIVSVGMYEHVGRPNLGLYIKAVADMLKPGGLALIHYISKMKEDPAGSFTTKYIFPGGYIPSLRETIALLPEQDLRVLDIENIRLHYAYTLDAWADNFEKNLSQVREIFANRERLGERWGGQIEAEQFIRMWRLYLRGSAAGFRSGELDLHQILVSKGANNGLPLTRGE